MEILEEENVVELEAEMLPGCWKVAVARSRSLIGGRGGRGSKVS